MRRYKLERSANGMITQCDNADGGNIYAQREQINKKAMENLNRATPGKLGNLSNLQIFNFVCNPNASGTAAGFRLTFNSTSGFPANATQTVMFGVAGINNKALYYNVVDIKASVYMDNGDSLELISDSYVEFYLLQNIETSTTSLGTKIPQPAPLSGNGGGVVDFITTGDIEGHQYIKTDCISDSVNIPSFEKGLRCSGLALKTIELNFNDNEDTSQIRINFQVFVDNTSVSSTF